MIYHSELDKIANTFMRYGYQKTSMNDVANEIGISRQALYNRFTNKEKLFNWVVCEMVATGITDLRAIFSDGSISVIERLTLGLDRWAGRQIDNLRSSPHSTDIIDRCNTILTEDTNGLQKILCQFLKDTNSQLEAKQAENYAFIIYHASEGLVMSAKDRSAYVQDMRRVIDTLLSK